MSAQGKTVDRIRKLLAVASDRGAAESEADTARRLADAMMAAAGLTEADIATDEIDPAATVAESTVDVVGSPRARWVQVIISSVCRVVGAHPYTSRRADGAVRLRVIGTEQARAAVAELLPWVIAQVKRATRAATPPANALTAAARRVWSTSYRYGLADGIAKQARQIAAHRDATPAESMALARRDAVAAAIAALRPKCAPTRNRAIRVYGAAFAAGESDAAAIALQRRAEGAGVPRLGGGS